MTGPMTMEELLKSEGVAVAGLKKGQEVKGKITSIKSKSIFIDIGGKTDAMVMGKEFEFVKDYVADLKVGDEIEVQVKQPENDKGQILVSIRGAASGYGWNYFSDKEKSGGEVTVFGKELNRGGIVVVAPFGFYGFIPGSQIGSKYDMDPEKMLGKKVAEKGYTLVYGGATGGLMDAVAEGASGENGEIIGVIPEIIIHSDRLSQLPTQQIVTTDMSERKKRLKEMADAFVVLPGGFGTLDEMFDVIASATVGEHKKPLICLNYNGFYNRLIQLADEMRTGYFIPKEEKYKPIFVNSVEECLERIEAI